MYRAPISGDSLLQVYFLDTTGDSSVIALDFTKAPVAGKLYRIVYHPKTENEVSISYWSRISRGGGSQDEPEQYLTVASEGNTLRFIATEIQVQEYTFVVDYLTPLSLNLTE